MIFPTQLVVRLDRLAVTATAHPDAALLRAVLTAALDSTGTWRPPTADRGLGAVAR